MSHNRSFTTKQYARKGDVKPRRFQVGDLFTFANGETAIVTEVFDRYEGKSKYGPEWTLRLMWTPGKNGEEDNRRKIDNPFHGVMRTNMFNQLSIGRGCHWYSKG